MKPGIGNGIYGMGTFCNRVKEWSMRKFLLPVTLKEFSEAASIRKNVYLILLMGCAIAITYIYNVNPYLR